MVVRLGQDSLAKAQAVLKEQPDPVARREVRPDPQARKVQPGLLVLPGRLVRLRALFGGLSYPLWQGYLEDITPRVDLGGPPTAELRAFGPLTRADKSDVRVAMQSTVLTGTAVGVLLNA